MEIDIDKILKKYWGYDSFRKHQKEIITSVLEGKDTLAILATGSGKSICYQIPSLATQSKCLVISPLIALIKDQRDGLSKRGIKSIGIHSGQDKRTQDILLDNAVYGNELFIFVSPERLKTPIFRQRLPKMNIKYVAIDEAHCISEWGHDFRPAYRDIAQLRDIIPDASFLALTATATQKVQNDIVGNLQLNKPNTFISSPVRKELSYQTFYTENKNMQLLDFLIKSNASSIIYVDKRKHTRQLKHFLQQRGIAAEAFHGGLSATERHTILTSWNANQIKTIIATNAFGMGMDKADVRQVIHYNIPDSLEAYVQEAGRAGRDGAFAKAILLWNNFELKELAQKVDKYFPDLKEVQQLYHNLAVFLNIASGKTSDEWLDFDLSEFSQEYGFTVFNCVNILNLIENAGYIELSDNFKSPSRVKIDEAYTKNYLRSKNKSTDLTELITTLLRNYDGISWDFRPIDESIIAKKMQIPPVKVHALLSKLETLELGHYKSAGLSYSINFKGFRHQAKHLKLPDNIYLKKKERMLEKIKAMIEYIHSEECRQSYISSYFGFKTNNSCQICDNCEALISAFEIEKLIKKNSASSDLKLIDILNNFSQKNQLRIMEILKQMESDNLLSIKEEKIYFRIER